MELKEHQKPLTVPEQIENLKALNLIIDDEKFAEDFLNKVSYFRFVKAYSLGLKPKNGQYADITFEHLVELYSFNGDFRRLLFAQIEKVEINLRCRISNYFSTKYGVLGYNECDNFENKELHRELLLGIKKNIKQNKHSPFIKNFQTSYKTKGIPFYALLEIISFGSLSKFFKNLKMEDKKNILSSYGGLNYTYFESWIESLAYVRNICAHYGRLYNAKLTKTPKLYKKEKDLGIKNLRIFGILCCLKYLLPSDRHWVEFADTIELLLEKYPQAQKVTMGFPDSWKEILLDQTP